MRTVESLMAYNVADKRLLKLLMVIFATLALTITAVGLYGVVNYTVGRRKHEMGIRMALGARARDVLRLVVSQGMRQALTGVGVGLVASIALTRFIQSLLFGVSATDALTFAGVAALLGGVALLACSIPARRATKVDPLIALRYEYGGAKHEAKDNDRRVEKSGNDCRVSAALWRARLNSDGPGACGGANRRRADRRPRHFQGRPARL